MTFESLSVDYSTLLPHSTVLMAWMRQIVAVVADLHRIGVIHNAICPRTIVLCKSDGVGGYTPRLSDFTQAFLGPVAKDPINRMPHKPPPGDPVCEIVAEFGRAPELKWPPESRRQTKLLSTPMLHSMSISAAAVDYFSYSALCGSTMDPVPTEASDIYMLGGILRFALTGLRAGDLHKNMKFPLELNPFEATDLLEQMQNDEPAHRFLAVQVPLHPLWWSSALRGMFLVQTQRFLSEAPSLTDALRSWTNALKKPRSSEDWQESVPEFLVALGKLDRPNTRTFYNHNVAHQLLFFADVYFHITTYSSKGICVGGLVSFINTFTQKCFPSLTISLMKQIMSQSSDRQQFVLWFQSLGQDFEIIARFLEISWPTLGVDRRRTVIMKQPPEIAPLPSTLARRRTVRLDQDS